MFTRFDHVATFSHNYTQNAKFYEALFGLKVLPHTRARGAILLSDGSMAYNHVALRTGFPSGLNHFGLQVDDVELAIERIREFDQTLDVQDRPPTRDIIAYSAPDHLGIRVESIDQLKQDLDELMGRNPHLRPWPIGGGAEGDARLKLFKKASPYAGYHMTDVEGVHLAIWEQ